jgi:hypothetical protein
METGPTGFLSSAYDAGCQNISPVRVKPLTFGKVLVSLIQMCAFLPSREVFIFVIAPKHRADK